MPTLRIITAMKRNEEVFYMIEIRSNQPVPHMYTIKKLAQTTHISEYCIRKLCTTNQITYIKAGTKFLINFDRFIDYLNGNS